MWSNYKLFSTLFSFWFMKWNTKRIFVDYTLWKDDFFFDRINGNVNNIIRESLWLAKPNLLASTYTINWRGNKLLLKGQCHEMRVTMSTWSRSLGLFKLWPIEQRTHKCKNRYLECGGYQSLSCQCSQTCFYANCGELPLTLYTVTTVNC
jgi:hypothetical protein